jgi:cancer susceptibility candidate protein 1
MPKKGKKKSKKQLEDELAKASEDQCRIEEQERLKKLEDDSVAEHKYRLDWELDSRLRVEEAERLEAENDRVAQMKGQRKQDLEYENQKIEDQLNWFKFISCNSRPNVAFENEITTYMEMVREERVQRVEEAMQKCRESEEIVQDLMELYCKAREEGHSERQEWCMRYINAIRSLEIDKIDEATAYLLQYIEKQETTSLSQVFLQWPPGPPGSAPWPAGPDDIKVGFWGHLANKGFRAKQIDFPKIQIGLDLPKSIAMQSAGHAPGVRALYTTYDTVQGKDPSNMPVGGMIRVDLLAIPPPSRKVNGWTIRQIPAPGQELLKLPYPNTSDSAASNISALPVKVEYKLPSRVIVKKAPTISWWDDIKESWSSEGITELVWEPEVRKISFQTARLASFSITQERHLDLPYTWWKLHPVAPQVCRLTVQAARYQLHFVISEDGLRLQGPDIPELHDIMYDGTGADRQPRVKSPATLLWELRECGLNLMPEDLDSEFLDGYTPKNPLTESRAYSDLSEIAGCWDIVSSCHNKSLPEDRFGPGSDRGIVRIRENLLFEEFDPLDPDCDTDYQSVMLFPDKACFVQSLEQKTPCNEKPKEGNLTHSSLYLCFEQQPNPGPNHAELMERLRVSCPTVRFTESVRQTMALMRLLSFT